MTKKYFWHVICTATFSLSRRSLTRHRRISHKQATNILQKKQRAAKEPQKTKTKTRIRYQKYEKTSGRVFRLLNSQPSEVVQTKRTAQGELTNCTKKFTSDSPTQTFGHPSSHRKSATWGTPFSVYSASDSIPFLCLYLSLSLSASSCLTCP